MNLTGSFAFVSDGEPFVHTSGKAERGSLEHDGTDCVIISNIFIENLDSHVISNVLNIDVVGLIPDGGLSSVLLGHGLEFLLTVLNKAEGVHLSEEFGITGKLGFDDSESELSGSSL